MGGFKSEAWFFVDIRNFLKANYESRFDKILRNRVVENQF